MYEYQPSGKDNFPADHGAAAEIMTDWVSLATSVRG
jgi:hypothetical protein